MENKVNLSATKNANSKNLLNENTLSITKAKGKDFFIDSIISSLEEVDPIEWEHFFNYKAISQIMPCNPISKTVYRGVNAFHLMLIQMRFKFESNHFATFKQISEAGGKVKKGAKSFLVEYYNYTVIHKETKKKISIEVYKNLSAEEKKEFELRGFLKNYNVFNFDQTENLNIETDLSDFNFDPIDNIDLFLNQVIENHSINVNYSKTDKAYFSPSSDSITLPLREFFKSSEAFYATCFHEIIHWTGIEDRLNRDMKGFFGNEKYAFEELVAEIGSMLILQEHSIFTQFTNSLAYLKGWLKATTTKDKNIELRNAFKLSKKAVNYLK